MQKGRCDGCGTWAVPQKYKMTASESSQENAKGFGLTLIQVFPWDFPKGGPTACTRADYSTTSVPIFWCHRHARTGCSPWQTLLIPEYSSLPSLLPLMFKSLHQMTGSTPIPEVIESPLHLSIMPALKLHSSSFIRLWQMIFLPLLCTRDTETEITLCRTLVSTCRSQ